MRKEIRIWKCKVFVQYLTVQIVLTERKTNLTTIFPFAQIFRKDWTERKLEKNKNGNNALCLPFIVFFTQSSQYQIQKANVYSILTIIKLGPLALDSSTRISRVSWTHWLLTQISYNQNQKLAIHRFITRNSLTKNLPSVDNTGI